MKVGNYQVNNQNLNSQNITNASPDNIQVAGGKGSSVLPQAFSSLSHGEIFEGTISRDASGKITIHLSNGESVMARMDAAVNLTENIATFFQVKSNENGQLALRVLTQDPNANPTLIKALEQAGVAVDKANIALVQEMMRQQLPIDAKSLANMVKLAYANKNVDVSTLIQLTKLGLPVTQENIQQFTQYMSGEGNVVKSLDTVMNQLPEALKQAVDSGMDGGEVLRQLSEAFVEGSPSSVSGHNGQVMGSDAQTSGTLMQATAADGQQGMVEAQNAQIAEDGGQNNVIITSDAQGQEISGQDHAIISNNAQGQDASGQEGTIVGQNAQSSEVIGQQNTVLSQSAQMNDVYSQMNAEGMPAKEILAQLTKEIAQMNLSKAEYKELFTGKEFKELLNKVMEQEWLLNPDEVSGEGKVKTVYERMEQQLDRLENLFQKLGQGEQFLQGAKEIRSNVQFMNDLNQFVNYVQIPLKMANQNAKGDLYVYTDKRAIRQGKEELTAHLHLELEHLGTTDVYVHLKQKKLATNFVMEKEESLDLIMENIDILTQRLQKKGYEITIHGETASEDSKPPSFMEEILSKEMPSVAVQRYSLDVCV